jgi:hypothetical protein
MQDVHIIIYPITFLYFLSIFSTKNHINNNWTYRVYTSSSVPSPSSNFFIYKFLEKCINKNYFKYPQFSWHGRCTYHHLPHHLTLIFLLSINSKKHIDNNYFKIPQLREGLPTSFIYLVVVCFVLGNSVSEPLFEDFQEQAFEDSKVFFSGQQGKCPWSTFTPIIFLSIL